MRPRLIDDNILKKYLGYNSNLLLNNIKINFNMTFYVHFFLFMLLFFGIIILLDKYKLKKNKYI